MSIPQDGYWRLRPLAPQGMAPTAFGSSFLVGPVEFDGRPIVKIKETRVRSKLRARSRLAFERGGRATLTLAKVDQNRHVLDVDLDQPIAGRAFAALRSMYVTEFNNDVARVAVREKGAKGWREEPIMAFREGNSNRYLGWPHKSCRGTTRRRPTWYSQDFSGRQPPNRHRKEVHEAPAPAADLSIVAGYSFPFLAATPLRWVIEGRDLAVLAPTLSTSKEPTRHDPQRALLVGGRAAPATLPQQNCWPRSDVVIVGGRLYGPVGRL